MKLPISIKSVLITPSGVILLKNNRLEWELPGGRIEHNESPEMCLKREFFEELSIDITVDKIIDSYVFQVIKNKFVFIVTYGVRLINDHEYKISDEHIDCDIFPLTQLPKEQLPDGYRRSILKWHEMCET